MKVLLRAPSQNEADILLTGVLNSILIHQVVKNRYISKDEGRGLFQT
jgi:hypothetical protein